MDASRSLERSVARTLILSIAAVMAVALILSALLLTQTIERRLDQRIATAAAELQTAITRSDSGGLVLAEPPLDPVFEERGSGWGWLARDGERILARSRSLAGGELPSGPQNVIARIAGDGGERRVLTVSVRGVPGLTLTVAAPQRAVWRELVADLRIVAGAIALLGAALALVAAWQAKRALAPAGELARDLESVRAGTLARLPESPIREVAAVHGLINDLLAERRQASADAQESAAKLAHGLKTPLAVIAARADVGGAAPDARVMEAVGAMQRLVTANLAAARATRRSLVGRQRTLIRPVLDDLVAAFRHKFLDRGIAADIDVPQDAAAAMPDEEFMEAAGNVLENAFRHARSCVTVRLRSAPDALCLLVSDDGPGFDAGPAMLPAPEPARETGNGLGLAITRDLLERHGGSLSIGASPSGGACVTLTLPHP